MKKVLSALLVLLMLLLFFAAWRYADTDYRMAKTLDTFGTTAATTGRSPETTELPETTAVAETTAAVTADTQGSRDETEAPDMVLLFGGDVNLDADYSAWSVYAAAQKDLSACIDRPLLAEMQNASIFMVGNLFAFTDSTQSENKRYTFRTYAENVSVLQQMGVDIVSLANNHVYDFGAVGLTDTLLALNNGGIIHVGAGENSTEAARVRYGMYNGLRIAYTAAMRSEKYINTPEATESSSGVMKMYTLDAYLEVIRGAAAQSDFVVAYVHWGTENSLTLEQEQIDGAHALIDAGADIVIGSHTHTLQTVEYYNGKPIFYSIGNLWSDVQQTESALVKVTLSGDGEVKALELIPCENDAGITRPASDVNRAAIFARLNQSATASVSPEGIVREKK
ncbi:MAG: CapA family protein [Clostridia bacterium]|nr:CapA family protein [Clostridia bacterium]